MKNSSLIILLIISVNSICQAQESKKLPSVVVKSMDGEFYYTSEICHLGKPVIILFWATWCRPCIKELTAIADLYDDWKEKTGVMIYAVSIDDSRTQFNIRPLIKSRGWNFEFYNDLNGDFKRAMGVVDIPHLFILNAMGEIIHQRTTYIEGTEKEIYDLIPK
jgi:cytochrome c biogenesis protein CcmG, thiol:disulfide interchange protein DsbE